MEEGNPAQGEDVLHSRLRAIEDELARLEKKRGMGKPAEKLVDGIDKLE